LRPVLLAAIPFVSLAVTACVDNYHPEYHPVSVSEISQNLSYPVSVQNGLSAAERGPVYVMPAPLPVLVQPPPIVVQPPPVQPPPMVVHPAPVVVHPAPSPGDWQRGY
jgi:hypothetical protein